MKLRWLLTIMLSAMMLGCPGGDDSSEEGGSGGASAGGAATTAENPPLPAGQHEPTVPDDSEETNDGETSSAEVSLQQTDWAGVMELVEGHKGKVVIVDLWSLSCEPCIIEFPNLVALAEQHPDEVACISVATDYQGLANRPLSHYEPRVLEFLQSQNAGNLHNVLCTTPKPDFFAELEIGSEPAIFVFNQLGQSKLFTGLQEDDSEVSYELHVTPYVESLLVVEPLLSDPGQLQF